MSIPYLIARAFFWKRAWLPVEATLKQHTFLFCTQHLFYLEKFVYAATVTGEYYDSKLYICRLQIGRYHLASQDSITSHLVLYTR